MGESAFKKKSYFNVALKCGYITNQSDTAGKSKFLPPWL